MRLVGVWAAVVFPSIGGGRRTLASDHLLVSCLQVPGAAMRVLPLPDSFRRRIWRLLKLKMLVVLRVATAPSICGVVPQERLRYDYPAAEGMLRVQGQGGARRQPAIFSSGSPARSGSKLGFSVIFFGLWTFL